MSPRRATWWLCLLIALLPLRGLAHGWMLGSMAGTPPVAAAGAGAGAMMVHDAAPMDHAPCHGADAAAADVAADNTADGAPDVARALGDAALGDAAAMADHDAGGHKSTHGCLLCDLCHSPLARVAEPAWALPAPVADGPAAAAGPAAPDAPSAGIFRPPRA